MIDLEHVICDLSPLDISLGVYPLGQLALAIYTKHHSPSHMGGPDVEAAAMEVSFTHNGVSTPRLLSSSGTTYTTKPSSYARTTT